MRSFIHDLLAAFAVLILLAVAWLGFAAAAPPGDVATPAGSARSGSDAPDGVDAGAFLCFFEERWTNTRSASSATGN